MGRAEGTPGPGVEAKDAVHPSVAGRHIDFTAGGALGTILGVPHFREVPMRLPHLHPFGHIHEPLRMELFAWLALLLGILLALLYQPGVHH